MNGGSRSINNAGREAAMVSGTVYGPVLCDLRTGQAQPPHPEGKNLLLEMMPSYSYYPIFTRYYKLF